MKSATALLLLLSPLLAFSQPSAHVPVTADPAAIPKIGFDVATFKLNRSGDTSMQFSVPLGGDGFTARNRPIHDLIRYAFAQGRGATYRITGQPSWVDDDRYDIQAKIALEDLPAWQKLDALQQKVVLQRFLTEALHLKFHPDPTLYPYYALVVGKGGPKLQEAPTDITPNGPEGKPVPRRTMLWTSPSDVTAYACEMQLLADQLAGHTDLPVLNHTDLHKYYNFTLHFDGASTSDSPTAPEVPFLGLPPNLATSSAISAVKQLGLELRPAKGPMDGMIIDHIERPPEN
jgi:uncharacterized protein (TIGR03435 family)